MSWFATNNHWNVLTKSHGNANFSTKNKNIYLLLKNKNIILSVDIGSSPEKKFSQDYQSGALSFEIYFKNIKLISNAGYFQNYKHQLNSISKSTATHSTLILDNQSSSKMKKNSDGILIVEKGLKILKKSIFSKNFHMLENYYQYFVLVFYLYYLYLNYDVLFLSRQK